MSYLAQPPASPDLEWTFPSLPAMSTVLPAVSPLWLMGLALGALLLIPVIQGGQRAGRSVSRSVSRKRAQLHKLRTAKAEHRAARRAVFGFNPKGATHTVGCSHGACMFLRDVSGTRAADREATSHMARHPGHSVFIVKKGKP